MTILWTDKTAAQATGGTCEGAWEASRVEIDSRKVVKGDLFVALKGENFDGHAYAASALEKGAVAAVVSHVPEGVNAAQLLVVSDTQKALEDLGRAGRKRSQAKVVGVTGSVGKTSAKEMLRLALSAHGETYATNGNYNNHIGTPLNLANLPPSAQFAVFEMGMNHAGEIAHLTKMVKPDVAVITNVEAVHLEFFDSLERIADAKAEIFESMEKGGVAVLNADNVFGNYLKQKAEMYGLQVLMCGRASDTDGQLLGYEPEASGCMVRTRIGDENIAYPLQVTGAHWAQLFVMVLTAVKSLGLQADPSARKIMFEFKEPEGRGRQVPIVIDHKEILIVDDSYNASPASMKAAIAKTAGLGEKRSPIGRKFAVLGDMLELGAKSAEFHVELAGDLQRHGFDKVFTAGALMQLLYDALPETMRGAHMPQAVDLLPVLRKELQSHDILLIKGSHGSKMYELVKALKNMTQGTGEQRHAV